MSRVRYSTLGEFLAEAPDAYYTVSGGGKKLFLATSKTVLDFFWAEEIARAHVTIRVVDGQECARLDGRRQVCRNREEYHDDQSGDADDGGCEFC